MKTIFKIIDGSYDKVKHTEVDIDMVPDHPEYGAQRRFDNTILNLYKEHQPDDIGIDITNAVNLGGFSKIEKLLEEKTYKDPDDSFRDSEEEYITLRREVNVEGNPLFPNLFKKFLKTGFVNIQSEEDMLEIYSKERWDQLSKQEQESSYNWDGDQPSADTEDDAEQYNKDE